MQERSFLSITKNSDSADSDTKLEDRRSLINNFVNAVVLHDDRIDFVFNYQDGTKTVTFEELKEESANSSDFLFG